MSRSIIRIVITILGIRTDELLTRFDEKYVLLPWED